MQAVNPTDEAMKTAIHLAGFTPRNATAQVTELAGPLAALNTANHPNTIAPQSRAWKHLLANGESDFTFPPRSVTVLRFE